MHFVKLQFDANILKEFAQINNNKKEKKILSFSFCFLFIVSFLV